MSQQNLQENGNGLLLYLHKYSFYSQKVILALHEKRLPYTSKNIDIFKWEQYQPTFLEINPKGEVPVLKDGMKIIPDSGRIIDYLEDNFSNGDHPRLIPQDPALKQKVNHLRELLDEIPVNSVTIGTCYHPDLICSPKLPFIAPLRGFLRGGFEKTESRLKELAESMPQYRDMLTSKCEEHRKAYKLVTDKTAFFGLLDRVDNVLEKVEDQLNSNKETSCWLVGPSYTVADLSLTTLLYRLDVVGLSNKFFNSSRRPLLHVYFQRIAARPAYQQTFPTLMTHIKSLFGFKVLGTASVALVAVAASIVYYYKSRSR